MNVNHIVGIAVAVLGTIAYSYFKYKEEMEKLKKEMYLPVATNDDVRSKDLESTIEDTSLQVRETEDSTPVSSTNEEKKSQEV